MKRTIKAVALLMMIMLVASIGLASAGNSKQTGGPAVPAEKMLNDFATVGEGEYIINVLPNGNIHLWDTSIEDGDHDGVYGHYVLKPVDIDKLQGTLYPVMEHPYLGVLAYLKMNGQNTELVMLGIVIQDYIGDMPVEPFTYYLVQNYW